jgi:integrase
MATERVTGHTKLRGKRPVWYLRYRGADGCQVQRRLGPDWQDGGAPPPGHYTSRKAQEALEAILTDERRKGPTKNPGATFADAAAEYLRFVSDVRKIDLATAKDYRGVIDGYLNPEFGDERLEAITPDMIDAYKERLISEGRLSSRVIVRHLTVLHGIFKRAKRVWRLVENPASADLVERPKVVYSGEFDTFNSEEMESLARAAASTQDGAIYLTAAYTGLRQGELLALRWRDVDFVGDLVHVRRNYTDGREKVPKGKRVRSVPMMPRVAEELARLKEREHFTADEDLVFPNDVGEFSDAYALRRRFYRALTKAKLRRIRFHDLRHHFGTLAIGVLDAYTVQSYMGHQHYSTTQRYLHHKPRREDALRLQAAADKSWSRDWSPTGENRPNGDRLTGTEAA